MIDAIKTPLIAREVPIFYVHFFLWIIFSWLLSIFLHDVEGFVIFQMSS